MIRNPQGVWNSGILCENCLSLLLHQGCVRPKNETDTQETTKAYFARRGN